MTLTNLKAECFQSMSCTRLLLVALSVERETSLSWSIIEPFGKVSFAIENGFRGQIYFSDQKTDTHILPRVGEKQCTTIYDKNRKTIASVSGSVQRKKYEKVEHCTRGPNKHTTNSISRLEHTIFLYICAIAYARIKETNTVKQQTLK